MNRTRIAAAFMLALICVSAGLSVYAQPQLSSSAANVYAQPSGAYAVSGTARAGALVTVEFTGSNGDTYCYNFTVQASGTFTTDVPLPEDMSPDLYIVQARVGEETVHSSRVLVSPMRPLDVLQNMVEAIQRTKQALEVYMAGLEESGGEAPSQVREAYRDAIEALEQARRYYGDEQYEAALTQARRAQTLFQRAFKAVTEPEASTTDAAPSPEITRARKMLDELWKVSQRLTDNGYNASALNRALREVEAQIDEAERMHNAGDREGSQRRIKAAIESMNRLRTRLEQLFQQVKARLAARYSEDMANRVEAMRTTLSQYQNRISVSERSSALNTLQATEQKLSQLKASLQSGNLEMETLEELSDDIDEAASNVLDDETRNTLREIDKAQAKIEALKRLERMGYTLSPTLADSLRRQYTLLELLKMRLMNSTQLAQAQPTDSSNRTITKTNPSNETNSKTEDNTAASLTP
ncbi:hypothetical protein JXL21_05630 [Candidatus Bathyarchaeota archaeon]|nr:hypothetical protein [Candidatus Bathyarchaeota archaeon]